MDQTNLDFPLGIKKSKTQKAGEIFKMRDQANSTASIIKGMSDTTGSIELTELYNSDGNILPTKFKSSHEKIKGSKLKNKIRKHTTRPCESQL